MTAREIAAALGNARPSGKDWRCRCPLCDHNNPTLCDDGGRLVVRCLSGCASRDVHKELCCRHLGGNGRTVKYSYLLFREFGADSWSRP